ncbi:peptidase P60 [Caballeronia sordidicola]|uniref:Peptidase P60 n=3 Tax=Caballeronia TaxID=1827195 RepID=A0A158HJA1_CABSO|nr:peptidase P60 [Caballeronia sordidicola]
MNNHRSCVAQRSFAESRTRMPQRKALSAQLVATALSGLILATGSGAASATTVGSASFLTPEKALDMALNGVEGKHTVNGIIQVGKPVSLNGDALLYDPTQKQKWSSQQNIVEGAPGSRLSDILQKAETMIGVPYSWGGNTPEQGLDCSGFVRYVYQKATGILLPRVSSQISRQGVAVSQTDLHPGDLVFFNTTRGTATHVGIYVGENQFIHAPKKGAFVRIESMKSAYWTRRYYGARRVA